MENAGNFDQNERSQKCLYILSTADMEFLRRKKYWEAGMKIKNTMECCQDDKIFSNFRSMVFLLFSKGFFE